MQKTTEQKEWVTYCSSRLKQLTPILRQLGFSLNKGQPHLGGERYLMHAITTKSGRKLILVGKRISDNLPVIIKATDDADGSRELEHERTCREAIQNIEFAYSVLRTPEEILFTKESGFLISIQKFLAQETPFLTRPIEEQFSLILASFKAQESAHATTYKHYREVKRTFGNRSVDEYIERFDRFIETITECVHDEPTLSSALTEAKNMLAQETETIEQYGGFLTHTDFVPHNFRVIENTIYMLDHSAIRFGNKYEGWARLTNFMMLYNLPLAKACITYVKENRTTEEAISFKMMRLYRLGEIIFYYTKTLPKSTGNLYLLNRARISLWTAVLEATLEDTHISKETIDTYIQKRDSLRSEDEKIRQKDLH